ncbi:NAD(P)H-quinone oxidoreductase subunit K, chloroplastic [Streptomyces violaceorubidus]
MGRRYSLWVFNFGLACCAIEVIAAVKGRHDFIRLGVIPVAPGPRQADLMVVSGTVADKKAPAVKRLYEQKPEPKYVISFGACSNCGGPYWDSYCAVKGGAEKIRLGGGASPARRDALRRCIRWSKYKRRRERRRWRSAHGPPPHGDAAAPQSASAAPPCPATEGGAVGRVAGCPAAPRSGRTYGRAAVQQSRLAGGAPAMGRRPGEAVAAAGRHRLS